MNTKQENKALQSDRSIQSENTFRGALVSIALPVTLQSLLQSSFSMIDQIMIGQYCRNRAGWQVCLHLFGGTGRGSCGGRNHDCSVCRAEE